MLLSSSIHLFWLAAQNASVKQLLLIRGHWAVPALRIKFFFQLLIVFQPISSYYIDYTSICYHSIWHYIYTHICVHFEAHLSRSHSKVHIFKLHKRQVSSPWHGCDNRPHKSHQKRRGAMVFPEDETLASLDFLQSDLHLSWRRMMKFTSIGTIKNTGKHQPWSSFKRVVDEKSNEQHMWINLNQHIWTVFEWGRQYDSIPTYFSADFQKKTCNI